MLCSYSSAISIFMTKKENVKSKYALKVELSVTIFLGTMFGLYLVMVIK